MCQLKLFIHKWQRVDNAMRRQWRLSECWQHRKRMSPFRKHRTTHTFHELNSARMYYFMNFGDKPLLYIHTYIHHANEPLFHSYSHRRARDVSIKYHHIIQSHKSRLNIQYSKRFVAHCSYCFGTVLLCEYGKHKFGNS